MFGLEFRLRKPTWYDVWQGLERAGRVFVGAFIAMYPVAALQTVVFGEAPLDVDLAKKAALAGTISAVQFLWRTFFPEVGRSLPVITADAVVVTTHPHGADVATDA